MKKIPLTVSVLLIAAALSGCANGDPSEPSRLIGASSGTVPCDGSQPVVTNSKTPAREKSAVPVENERRAASMRLSYIEFLVKPEEASELSLLMLGDNSEGQERSNGLVYAALLKSVRSGGARLAVLNIPVLEGVTMCSKGVALYRYPESYVPLSGDCQNEETPPSLATNKDAAEGSPASNPKPNPPGRSLPIPACLPQEFTVQEVGLTVECTPTLSEDRKTVLLELHESRISLDAELGKTIIPGTFCPSQPLFSVRSTASKLVLTPGVPLLLRQTAAASLEEEKRTSFVFIRAD